MSQEPKPTGQPALTGAERQARYRARHATAPVTCYRRPTDRRSRLQRWVDAVAELVALQAEYAVWFEALPEPVQNSSTGEALQPSSISTSMRSSLFSRPAASDAIRDGGHPKIRSQSRISDRLTKLA
jgi:hypothetical protein